MTAALWTSEDAAIATGGKSLAAWQAHGVSIDSRSVAANDLFVALSGPNHDGHDYVTGALQSGAAGGLVSRVPDGLGDAPPLLVVDDTLEGLRGLGVAARARTNAKIVAITGSAGKTGTKEALRHVLGAQAPVHASASSFNNHWGVPLSLARMPLDARFGVFEIGMNHAGEITPLVAMVRPHVAIITNIGTAHLEFLGSQEAIADAKAEILSGVEPGGTAVLNLDDAFFPRLEAAAKAAGIDTIIRFGAAANSDARLLDATPRGDGTRVDADILGTRVTFDIPLPGRHWVQNGLAVMAAAAAAGADVPAAARAFATLAAMPGRGERHMLDLGGRRVLLIDESYNANPASMRAAIATLGSADVEEGGRRIAVLGEMRELGPTAKDLHAELAGPLLDAEIDLVLTAGADMATLNGALPATIRGAHAATGADLIRPLTDLLRDGDAVMVKGSNASGMNRVVAALLAA